VCRVVGLLYIEHVFMEITVVQPVEIQMVSTTQETEETDETAVIDDIEEDAVALACLADTVASELGCAGRDPDVEIERIELMPEESVEHAGREYATQSAALDYEGGLVI
jgi:hypothetical protein